MPFCRWSSTRCCGLSGDEYSTHVHTVQDNTAYLALVLPWIHFLFKGVAHNADSSLLWGQCAGAVNNFTRCFHWYIRFCFSFHNHKGSLWALVVWVGLKRVVQISWIEPEHHSFEGPLAEGLIFFTYPI